MTLFGAMSTLLVLSAGTLAPFLVIVIIVPWASACTYIVLRNEHVRALLKQGWLPLFGAMLITSASGIVLDLFVSRYDGYALLAVAFGGTNHSSAQRFTAYILRANFFSLVRHSRWHRLDLRIPPLDSVARSYVHNPR
jgi:solute carrier family 41